MPLFIIKIAYPALEFASSVLGPLMLTTRFATAGAGGGRGGAGAEGVTLFEGRDGRLLPTWFSASTTNVYVTPFVRPVINTDVWAAGTVIDRSIWF